MNNAYWDEYYRNKENAPSIESPFAIFLKENGYLEEGKYIADIGCGNGRDSYYFNNNKMDVIAIDQSKEAIESINNSSTDIQAMQLNAKHISHIRTVDIIYSRFSIHSMSYEEQLGFIYTSHDRLAHDGLLCIEARTTNDKLCGQGTKGEDTDSYVTDHYRRFIKPDDIISAILPKYDILYLHVSKGLAMHKDEDPECIRLVARIKKAP